MAGRRPWPPEDVRAGTVVFAEAVEVLGLPPGVQVDETRCEVVLKYATEDVEVPGLTIRRSHVAAMDVNWIGVVDGRRDRVRQRWLASDRIEPAWTIEHGYLVEVTGDPNLRCGWRSGRPTRDMAHLDKHTMHSIGMRITACPSSTPSRPCARPRPASSPTPTFRSSIHRCNGPDGMVTALRSCGRSTSAGARCRTPGSWRSPPTSVTTTRGPTSTAATSCSGAGRREALERSFAPALEEAFGFEVTTSCAPSPSCARPWRSSPSSSLQATPTSSPSSRPRRRSARSELEGLSGTFDTLVVAGRDVHWHMRGKSTDTKVPSKAWERAIGHHTSTSRNTTMLRKLVAKIDERDGWIVRSFGDGLHPLEGAEHVPAVAPLPEKLPSGRQTFVNRLSPRSNDSVTSVPPSLASNS